MEQRLSLADAAERVLRTHSKGAPLHYRRITEIAIGEGLVTPGGTTPEASMNAALTVDMQRSESRNDTPRFIRHAAGQYGLYAATNPLDASIQAWNGEVKDRLRSRLGEMDPFAFESFVASLLEQIGFTDVNVTRATADGGIDIRANLAAGGITNTRTAIQVKRWKNNVGSRTVQELRGSLRTHEQGLIITTSDFGRGARVEASDPEKVPITLVNGEQLVELLLRNQIGVTQQRLTVFSIDEESLAAFEQTEAADPSATPTVENAVEYAVRAPLVRTSDKALAMWPLPGGGTAWKSTLDTMLSHVAVNGPTVEQAVKWMIAEFEKVASPKTARGYWHVPRSFGLLTTVGENLTLTSTGSAYIANPTNDQLLKIACDSVVGFNEIIGWLRDGGPKTPDELLAMAVSQLGVRWTTPAQITWRLGWLKILGVTSDTRGTWAINN